jgi:hypothetical protein
MICNSGSFAAIKSGEENFSWNPQIPWKLVSPELRDSQLLEAVKETLAATSRRPKLYLDWGLVRTGGLHNESIEERSTARGREMIKLLQQEYA